MSETVDHQILFHMMNGDVERMDLYSSEPVAVLAAVIASHGEFIDAGNDIHVRRDHIVSIRLVKV